MGPSQLQHSVAFDIETSTLIYFDSKWLVFIWNAALRPLFHEILPKIHGATGIFLKFLWDFFKAGTFENISTSCIWVKYHSFKIYIKSDNYDKKNIISRGAAGIFQSKESFLK